MSILVCVPDRNLDLFIDLLHQLVEDEIFTSLEKVPNEKIEIAILWKHPKGIISACPNLKLICSFGAGVDHILSDPDYNASIPVTRIVDKELNKSMTNYVLRAISLFQYEFNIFKSEESRILQPKKALNAEKLAIGIMGLGELGSAAGLECVRRGYKVAGISRQKKYLPGIHTFGLEEMEAFLSGTNILVCMLPLTDQTRNIIRLEILNKLKQPSYFINVGRGDQVDEEDLLKAIQDKILKGACLDVVKNEPFTRDHLLALEPRIIVTPHMASITNQENAARIIAENILRFKAGKDLIYQVDPELGY